MGTPAPENLTVRHAESVGEARRRGKALAAALDFDPDACEQVALVVAELATNLVKHAGGGELRLTPLGANGRIGLQVESIDQGPGIVDVDRAVTDGFSTAGSLGVGLGTVSRLMDDLEITSARGSGTRVVCRTWRRRYAVSPRTCPLEVGVATRPRLSGEPNGDAFVVRRWEESVLVALIDGLGHGQFAHRAAQAARQYVEGHFDLPFEQTFRGVGLSCRATRGVVMALARFDWGHGRVTLASVGNIEVRIFPSGAPFHFQVRRGIVGLNAPRPLVTEHPWRAEHVMVVHSDGLSTRWGFKDFPGLEGWAAADAAQELLRALGKDDDDATVIVVRSVAA